MDHHPDIDIRYTKIIMSLSTHDAGGITQSDLDCLAERIEGVSRRTDHASPVEDIGDRIARGCGTPAANASCSTSTSAAL